MPAEIPILQMVNLVAPAVSLVALSAVSVTTTQRLTSNFLSIFLIVASCYVLYCFYSNQASCKDLSLYLLAGNILVYVWFLYVMYKNRATTTTITTSTTSLVLLTIYYVAAIAALCWFLYYNITTNSKGSYAGTPIDNYVQTHYGHHIQSLSKNNDDSQYHRAAAVETHNAQPYHAASI